MIRPEGPLCLARHDVLVRVADPVPAPLGIVRSDERPIVRTDELAPQTAEADEIPTQAFTCASTFHYVWRSTGLPLPKQGFGHEPS